MQVRKPHILQKGGLRATHNTHSPSLPHTHSSGHGPLADQWLPRLQKPLWEKNLQFKTFIIYWFFLYTGRKLPAFLFWVMPNPKGQSSHSTAGDPLGQEAGFEEGS